MCEHITLDAFKQKNVFIDIIAGSLSCLETPFQKTHQEQSEREGGFHSCEFVAGVTFQKLLRAFPEQSDLAVSQRKDLPDQ